MHAGGALHAARGQSLAWQEQKRIEVLIQGTVAATAVPALLVRLRSLCVGSERELCRWERTLQSTLPAPAADQASGGVITRLLM